MKSKTDYFTFYVQKFEKMTKNTSFNFNLKNSKQIKKKYKT